jgi:hypothetical protein
MTVTIKATVGASDANSYVTLEEAETYFGNRPASTAWTALGNNDAKSRVLIAACMRLDVETYKGERVAPQGQALKWPRVFVLDEDGWEYPSNVIITPVKQAQMELALAMAASGEDWLADTGLEQFEQGTVGPLSFTRDKGFTATQLPAIVGRLLTGLRETAGGFRIVRS